MEIHTPERFNKAELVGTFDAGSAEWLEARYSGIGGSDIGTILGLNPWESAYALWAKKTKQIPESDLSGNVRVRLGQKFERPILEMWQEDNPDWKIFETATYRHSQYPYMMANPDALAYNESTGEWIVIEVKTSAMPWEEVPAHYYAQVQHYMFVMGIKRALLIGVVGWQWWESEIVASDFETEVALDYATRFWNDVQNGTKPDWDGSDATFKAVKAMNPEVEDGEVDLEWGGELFEAQRVADESFQHLQKLKSMTLDKMQSARHAYGFVNGERVRVASRQMRGSTPTLIVRRK